MQYSDLQERIRVLCDKRSDLQQTIYDYSQARILYWSAYFFYSSDVTDTSITTSPGQTFYNLPNGMRNVRAIRLLIPGNNNAYTTTGNQAPPFGPISFTLVVGTTMGFTTSGTILVGGSQVISYTGITDDDFTGTSVPTNNIAPGVSVTQIQPSTNTTAPVTFPAITILVASTQGFQSAGVISLGGTQATYASLTSTSFNGVVGGTGTVASGSLVQQLYGIWIGLAKKNYDYLLYLDTLTPSNRAIPAYFAQFNTQFRLYSVPDLAYPLEVTGNAAPAPPLVDADDNFWTEDAADLIIYSTAAEIKSQVLDDPNGAQRFQAAMVRERQKLMKVSIDLSDPHILRSSL